MDDRALNELKLLSEHWNDVESRAKEIEQLRSEVVVPAINEMRYAGRRIVDALHKLHNSDEKVREDGYIDIRLARQYLFNADHDLSDAMITFVSERSHEVLGQLGMKRLDKFLPNHKEYFEKLRDAHDMVQQSRKSRDVRADLYIKLSRDYVPYFLREYTKIRSYELAAMIRERKTKIMLTCWSIFAGIGTVVGLVGSYASIMSYKPMADRILPNASNVQQK